MIDYFKVYSAFIGLMAVVLCALGIKFRLHKKKQAVSSGTDGEDAAACPDAKRGNTTVRLAGKGYVAAGLTDPGRVRANNEDNLMAASIPCRKGHEAILCAVADGMGGQACGEVASAAAVQSLQESRAAVKRRKMPEWRLWLQEAVGKANAAVVGKGLLVNSDDVIGSTLVAVLIHQYKAAIANAGDSRAYLMRNHELHQITRDHSLVSLLVEKAIISAEEAHTHPRRNELMKFLGRDPDINSDSFEVDLQPGDLVLLCSDGLWGMVRDPQIASIMELDAPLEILCQRLVEAANLAGGQDNITVMLVKVG